MSVDEDEDANIWPHKYLEDGSDEMKWDEMKVPYRRHRIEKEEQNKWHSRAAKQA